MKGGFGFAVLVTVLFCQISYAQFAFDLDKFISVTQIAKEESRTQNDYSAYIEQVGNMLFTYSSLFETYGTADNKAIIEKYLNNPYYICLWEGAKHMLNLLDDAYIAIGLNRDNYLKYIQLDKIRKKLQKFLKKVGHEGIYPNLELQEDIYHKKIKLQYYETYMFSAQFKRIIGKDVSVLVPISEWDSFKECSCWGTQYYSVLFDKQNCTTNTLLEWIKKRYASNNYESFKNGIMVKDKGDIFTSYIYFEKLNDSIYSYSITADSQNAEFVEWDIFQILESVVFMNNPHE